MSYVDISLPIKTSAHPMAGKTISATAGMPGLQLGCAAGPAISAYGATKVGETSGGGGTAANKQFKANDGENLVGDGA